MSGSFFHQSDPKVDRITIFSTIHANWILNFFSSWFELQVLAPLPIGFAVFVVVLATSPITGTGINPARSFGAAVIYNNNAVWDDQVCMRLLNFFIMNCHRICPQIDNYIILIYEINVYYNGIYSYDIYWIFFRTYSGFSGLDLSLELPLLHSITSTS